MDFGIAYTLIVVIVTVTIVVSSIGVVISIKIQKKQKKKYQECIDIINKNKDITFQVKDSLTKDEINIIDATIDVDKLMDDLYNTFLKLECNIKELNTDFDEILTGYLKEFYVNKIENFKENNYGDITDSIDLIGYSITEFNKQSLKFRVTIHCLNYKTIDSKIVSGNNLFKVEQIILLSYEKVDNKWLISSYDKIYEKKLSD